ncbi:MAG: integrase arm-type DNA-binding domain-containing protein [Magnetococcales bacterium]|nr:integrase arm-type DNA-binding domain-containing protein [Magnetococcales bacterium]
MGKLTKAIVERRNKKGLLSDGDGLYLQITATGCKSWIFRFRDKSQHRYHGLGPIHTLSLAEAREAARECRKLRLEGLDPIEEKKRRQSEAKLKAAKTISFSQCAEAYIESHRSGWKNAKHAKQWGATLSTYVYPVFGELPVAEVNVGLIMRAIEPIWTSKPETAGRVRGRIEAVLDWAKVRGYRTGENPAQWKGNLSHLLPARSKISKVNHHAALPHAEMAIFWKSLSQQKGTAAQALRFAILTATRTSETLEATWEELDMEKCVWTIPAERMKGGKEHRVPLSPATIAILKDMERQKTGDYIFPGMKSGRPLSNMTLLAVLKRMKRPDLTTHGFRSTFRDWAAECTDTPREVAEAALAHTLSDNVEAAYRRSDLFDKRQKLMEEWADYCNVKIL